MREDFSWCFQTAGVKGPKYQTCPTILILLLLLRVCFLHTIQEMELFRKKSDTQKILVPAGSAPCTMQFSFTNSYSTLLEKVRLGYKIRVIPPSVETVKLGRTRRTKSSINFLQSQIASQREVLKESSARVAELDRDAARIQNEINERTAKLEQIKAEEERLKNLIGSARPPSRTNTRTNPRINGDGGNSYFNGDY